jgi:hypothetical protein
MRYTGILAIAAIAAAAMSGSAFAATVTTSGNVPQVCGVTVSNQAFDINKLSQQRIADLVVQCNYGMHPTLKVTPSNGNLKNDGIDAIAYTYGVDLAGPINAYQTNQIPSSTSTTNVPLVPGPELALGVPGDMTMIVSRLPWAAGTYSESFTLTVN